MAATVCLSDYLSIGISLMPLKAPRPAFLYTAPCPKTVRVAINTGKRKLAVNRDSQAENLWHNRHPS